MTNCDTPSCILDSGHRSDTPCIDQSGRILLMQESEIKRILAIAEEYDNTGDDKLDVIIKTLGSCVPGLSDYKKGLKHYVVQFPGHYLTGYAVVRAANGLEARKITVDELVPELGVDITETRASLLKQDIHILFDGDY